MNNKIGFYKSKTRDAIYYIYKNEEDDKDKYPLLVSTFEYESVINGRKRYEDETGNDVALEYLEDEYDDIPLKFKFTTIANENDAIIEDKLSNEEKLEKIKKICNKESTKTTFVSNGRDYTEVKDAQKLAIRILKVLQD